jgi:hypothetical protein
MAKKGDTGRTRKDGDDGASRKKDSGKTLKKTSGPRKTAKVADNGADDDGDAKPKKKTSARAVPAGPPPGNEKGKKMFLLASIITIPLLLAFGIYLATLPDHAEPQVIKKSYDEETNKAREKYNQAKKLYKEGMPLEGDAGAAKLRQAKGILSEAQEIINKMRDEIDEIDKKEGKTGNERNAQGQQMNYPFEELAQQIDMLVVDCNKELRAK